MMLSTGTGGTSPHDEDIVAIVVDVLRRKFGDEAAAVAAKQADLSEGAMRTVWREISETLAG